MNADKVESVNDKCRHTENLHAIDVGTVVDLRRVDNVLASVTSKEHKLCDSCLGDKLEDAVAVGWLAVWGCDVLLTGWVSQGKQES